MSTRVAIRDAYHHGDLRRALIDEAGRVLETEGEEAVTLRGLARALDVSHAAPGHHFADRQALLAELAADGFRDLSDAIAGAMDGAVPDDRLSRCGAAYVGFGVDHPARYRLMFTSQLLLGDCPERLRTESSRAYALLLQAAYRDAGPPAPDPATYRLGSPELQAWSVMHGAVMLFIDGQLGPTVDRVAFLALADRIVQFGVC